jgi:hypothetical protein
MSDNPIPIAQAAREVHKARSYVKGLIDAGKVRAFVSGGNPKHPRLRVHLEELRHAIARESIYIPPSQKHQPPRRKEKFKMHPAAAAM